MYLQVTSWCSLESSVSPNKRFQIQVQLVQAGANQEANHQLQVLHSRRLSAVLGFCFLFFFSFCFVNALSDWLQLLRLDGQEVKEQVPGTHTRKNLTILISSLSQNMHTHAQTAAQEQPNRQTKKKIRKKICPVPCKSFFFFFPVISNYLCLLSFFSQPRNNTATKDQKVFKVKHALFFLSFSFLFVFCFFKERRTCRRRTREKWRPLKQRRGGTQRKANTANTKEEPMKGGKWLSHDVNENTHKSFRNFTVL